MSREFHPHINESGTTECSYAGCGREIPADHYLCLRHYKQHQDGLAGPCPSEGCRRFRSLDYERCADWGRAASPEADPAGRPATSAASRSTPTCCYRADGSTPATPGTTGNVSESTATATARPRRWQTAATRPTRVVPGIRYPGRGGGSGAGAQAVGAAGPAGGAGPGVPIPGRRPTGGTAAVSRGFPRGTVCAQKAGEPTFLARRQGPFYRGIGQQGRAGQVLRPFYASGSGPPIRPGEVRTGWSRSRP